MVMKEEVLNNRMVVIKDKHRAEGSNEYTPKYEATKTLLELKFGDAKNRQK